MNRSISLLFALSLGMGVFAGCGNSPHCETVVAPETCEPACDNAGGEFCNPDNLECEAAMACDPVACDPGNSYCDIFTGNCVDLPAACDPTCGADEYCDDGTCMLTPVCSPACTSGEVCVN